MNERIDLEDYFVRPTIKAKCSGGEYIDLEVKITGNNTYDDGGFENMNYNLLFPDTLESKVTGSVLNPKALKTLASEMVTNLCTEKGCVQSGCFLQQKNEE